MSKNISPSGSQEIVFPHHPPVEETQHEGKTWSVRNPITATALKFTAIGLVALVIIGSLVGIGASGGFGPGGWLQHKVNLTVGQGLLYIGLPVVGAGAVTALGCNYGPEVAAHFTEKLKVHREEQEQTAHVKEILAFQEELEEEEGMAKTT